MASNHSGDPSRISNANLGNKLQQKMRKLFFCSRLSRETDLRCWLLAHCSKKEKLGCKLLFYKTHLRLVNCMKDIFLQSI